MPRIHYHFNAGANPHHQSASAKERVIETTQDVTEHQFDESKKVLKFKDHGGTWHEVKDVRHLTVL